MIIDYDHKPALTVDQKLQSLKDSVQMALNEAGSGTSLIAHQDISGKADKTDTGIDPSVTTLFASLGWVQD